MGYTLRPDRDIAFREMDAKWDKLTPKDKAAIVKNTDTFNRFAAKYATLTGKQVMDMIDKVKGTDPTYKNIDTNLIKSLIFVESSNNFLAISKVGALGLGQILKGEINAEAAFKKLRANLNLSAYKYSNLALDERTLPEHNIKMALDYIVWLSQRPYIAGDIDKILAAYNWGPGNFFNWYKIKGNRWFEELSENHPVRQYIEKIKKLAGIK